jgi:hypothetical protein
VEITPETDRGVVHNLCDAVRAATSACSTYGEWDTVQLIRSIWHDVIEVKDVQLCKYNAWRMLVFVCAYMSWTESTSSNVKENSINEKKERELFINEEFYLRDKAAN